MVKIGNK